MQATKRLLALLMCLVMLFTAVPMEAFATGEVPSDGTVATEPVPDTTEATSDSAEATEAPTEVTEAPTEVTEAPEEVTEAPEEVTEAPTEETEEPSEPSEEELMIMALEDGDVVKVEHNGETTYYATLQKAFDGFAPSNYTYGGTYVVTLLGDVTGNLNKNLQYPTEVLDITLDLNGHTITGDGTTVAVVINFGSANSAGCSVTINDSVGSGMITGGKGGVKLDGKGSTLYFAGGNITGNHGASKGGGIFMGATAKLVMTGGAIYGNSVTGSSNGGWGGGVLANYADILGGAIYGNTANGSTGNSGRGGGVCTEITRTSGYSTLTIADGVVYGNTATNAGDDVMAQGNGLSRTKFTLSIGTENWYIDGWNGTKATVGQTDRYNAENPVAYTDGGFSDVNNKTVGLKYVAPTVEEVAPEAPYYKDEGETTETNVDGQILTAVCAEDTEHTLSWYYHDGAVQSVSEVTKNSDGDYTCTVVFNTAAYVTSFNSVVGNIEGMQYGEHWLADETQTTVSVEFVWNEETEKWNAVTPGIINLDCVFTVTYTDGVEGEEIFADQVYEVTKGAETPAFEGEPTRENYPFLGWTPEVSETVTGDVTYTATWVQVAKPDAPEKFGKNVTEALVRVICDTDSDHAPLDISWQHQSTKVRDWVSGVVWSEEYGAWIVPIRIDSIDTYYLWQRYEDTVNEINHDLASYDPVTGGESPIDTYLKWDEEAQLWVTLDGNPIELHVVCKTVPDAPTALPTSAQIQVKGDLDGDGIYGESKADCALGVSEVYTTTIPKTSGYTLSEVYGSREEGFFVDVTVTLEDGDIYITNWIAQRAPGQDYSYNWDMTQKTVTFTLKYDRSTTGTLYGANLGDWAPNYSGYKVGEAYVRPTQPAAPEQKNVTAELVTVICDSDPERHAPVTGKWYPNHCDVISTSEIAWNEELSAWTVDVKIGGLYIMYVDQLEDANGGTIHELVDDITTVYTTLKWDVAQGLWFPVEPIELHTTCRTVPVAPVYKHQLDGYQIKVRGDLDGDGVYGESKATNDGIGEVWTTSIPENGYTISEVYGSREEGFFVDVTVTIENGDVYITNWIEQCDPGAEYVYDFEKTPETVTFTLKYTGSLTGTLYGDRYASNTNVDWVLETTGKDYGVIAEGYVDEVTYPVRVTIYRNGNTTAPYAVIALDNMAKGDVIDLSELDINEYYSSAQGFEFEGWFNDGKWNQYKAGKEVTGLDEITVNGWTNIICMVTDYQKVVVKAVTNGDKDNAETIFSGKALYGENLVEWLNANVEVPEKTGYTADMWYNWDWYGHKYDDQRTVSGWTNVYVTYTANTYTLTLNPDGGKVDPATLTVTYDAAIGELPEPTKTNCIFAGWFDENGNEVTAETVYTVTGDSTVTAKWIKYPGSSSTNVTNELFTIQCTEVHDHSWLCNWFGSHVKLVTGSVHYNEELGRWEAQCKIGSSMLSQINSTQPRKNYFGNFKHYYDETNYVFDLYYDPNFTGLNSQRKEVTGMWLPVEDYVVPVYCYTAPAMPNVAKITSTMLWMRDAGNKLSSHSQKFTGKTLIDGTYTLGEMYTENGKFYVDLTITDLAPYIEALGGKTGKSYVLPEWEKHLTLEDCKFTLVYTGSATDYKQDGTGWSIDASSWSNNSEKLNGKSLWLTEQFTVTYTDGAEGKVFADQTYTVYAHTENGATKNAVTDFSATATPTFEVPARTGYTFEGWSPEWSETVTGDVTYVAVWTMNIYNITVEANEGGTVTVQDTAVFGEIVPLSIVPDTGYRVVSAKLLYQGKNGPVTTTVQPDSVRFRMPAADVTLVVEFEQINYNITVVAGEHGSVEVQSTAVFGEIVPLNMIPDTGYSVASAKLVYEGKNGTVTTTVKPDSVRFRMPAADVTLYVEFVANEYTVTFNPNGGAAIAPITVTFDAKYGRLPSSALTGFSGGDSNWYLVDENGNVTDTKITRFSVVSTARDHELFVVRKILNPSVKIALTVPGGLSDGYKYYDGNPRVLTATVSNMNEAELDYSYQWYKDGVLIEGATESVLTLDGNVSDSGTYKVVVTATLKDGSKVIVTNESASGEKTQKVQIMRAANTLRLNYNYGETPETHDSYFGGATATLRTTLEDRDGYTFEGWNTAADGSGENYLPGDVVEFPGDNGNGGVVLELYANWKGITYTIKYNGGEGSEYTGSEPNSGDNWMLIKNGYTYGEPVTLHNGEGFSRTGYKLVGWTIAGVDYELGQTVEKNFTKVQSGTVQAYAIWEPITYTIKYNGGEGSEYTGSEPNSGDNWMLIKNGYTYDEPVTLHDGEGFVRDGYKLVGWTIGGMTYELGQTVEKNFTKVQSGTVQAYAIWLPITYTIKYNGGEGSEYTGTEPNRGANWMLIKNGYTYDASVTLDDGADFVRTGYTLVGWKIAGEIYELGQTVEKNFTKVQSGTVQAYAVWEGNTYTLTLDANGGQFVMPLAEDSDAVTTLEIPVTYGEAIGELPVPEREGYTFAGWFDAEGNEVTAETVYTTDGNMTVTAQWTPNTYEVTLDANGGELEDTSVEVTYGEPIGELPTPTRDGYTFAGWVDADGNKVTADTVYDVADDITLIASWNVNKPADPSSPATGDGMTVFFMASMLLSAAALLLMADRKRRMA